MIEVTIEGIERTNERLDEVRKVAGKAVLYALYEQGQIIMDESQKHVPVQTGELRDSAYVSHPDHFGGEEVVELGYGAEHAVSQHEKMEARAPKYLERAVHKLAKGQLHKIAERAEEAVASGHVQQPTARYPYRPPGGT